MMNVSAPPRSAASAATSFTEPAKAIGALAGRAPRIEFDSSNFDELCGRTLEIEALASCVTCLTAVAAAGDGKFNGYILIDPALPTLGDVILRLAREANDAGHALWEQLVEARAIANGEVQS